MKTQKQINQAIRTIKNRGQKQREHVQETAVAIVQFFETVQFNATMATDIVEALGKGVQSEKLVNWFEKYGGCKWDSKEKKMKKGKGELNSELGELELWYDMEGESNVMSPEEKLAKKFLAAVKLVRENPELAESYGLFIDEVEAINNAA